MTPPQLGEMKGGRALNPVATPSASDTALQSLARVIRSKNAGPTQLTIDIFLRHADAFALAARSSSLSVEAVAALYRLPPVLVQRHLLPDILAIKFTLPRSICAGDPGDGDVYGAQQHAPLLGVVL